MIINNEIHKSENINMRLSRILQIATNEFGSAVYGPGQVAGPSLLLTDEESG